MMITNRTLRSQSCNLLRRGFSSSSKKKARVVVVGSGRMGQIRASLVRANPRYQLVGIVDPVLDRAEALAYQFDAPAYSSLSEAIERSSNKLNGVIVSSPTFTHEAVIKEAADSKLHVFTEKPVDETADKIEDVFAYAENAGIKLCCSFQRRFDPSYVACAESVQNGAIGSPHMANLFFADHPCPPKEFLLAGGNIFMDLLAHDADYIMNALQDDVVSVYAVGTSSDEDLVDAGVHDNATVVMNFEKGTTVTLFMSRSAVYGYDQRCEVFGSAGHVSIDNIHQHTATLSNLSGIHQARLEHSFPQRFHSAFAMELDGFCDVLLSDKAWPITKSQCINVQRVADAARRSAETGMVVPVETYNAHTVPVEEALV